MVNDCVQKRHMIQEAQVAAVHTVEWRVHSLDIAPEAKFGGDAGGGERGSETGASGTMVSMQENGGSHGCNAQECEAVQEGGRVQ